MSAVNGRNLRLPLSAGTSLSSPSARPDLRLVLPALSAWSAAGILIGLPAAALPVAGLAWAAALTVGGAAIVARHRPGAAPVALSTACVVLLAAALACSSVLLLAPSRVPIDPLPGRSYAVSAEVTGPPRPMLGSSAVVAGDNELASRILLPVTLRTLELDGGTVAAAAPALVFADGAALVGRSLPIGAMLSASVTLSPAEPGDDISYLAFSRGDMTVEQVPVGLLAWADGLRTGFRSASATLAGDGAQLLPGLAIGDTSGLGSDLETAMKATSLTHLTAVSGANCAIIVAGVLALGAVLRLRRGVRTALALAALAAFVIIVTPQPSVQRAAVMAAVVLLAVSSGRTARGMPALCAAVLALLVFDPWLARSYGFALSVLATAGLLLLARPLTAVLARRLPVWLAAAIAIPLAAQLVCQPLLILLDPTLPLYGVLANLLTAPAAPAATIVGLAACLLLPVAPPIGLAMTQVAWLPAAWIAATAQTLADFPASRLPWLGGLQGVALLVLATALVLAALARSRLPARLRFAAPVAAALVALSYAAILVGSELGGQLSRPGDWQIASCDVGQGDATVLRSAGQVLLIDTGPEEDLLLACLDDLGIGRIDLLVLSHFDIDHVGGAAAIAGRVDRVLIGPSDGEAADRLIGELAAGGARVESATRGLKGVLGDVSWRVLWPPGPQDSAPPPELGNASSVTLVTEGAGLRAMFLGDLGESSQAGVLAGEPSLQPVDVVKVAHHGSADQSEALYRRLGAEVALISCGRDNDYGHPNARLLNLLAASGTVALRTDTEGMLLIAPGQASSPTREVIAWTEREEPAPITTTPAEAPSGAG